LAVSWSDNDLKKELVDFFGGGEVKGLVCGQNASKSRNSVGLVSLEVGFFYGGGGCHAASIGVLNDDKGCFAFELFYQVNSGIDIDQVVVGKLFAVKLLKEPFEVAIIASLLVRVFAIAEASTLPDTFFKSGYLKFAVKVLVDGGIVMGGYIEGLSSKTLSIGKV
jgi:hypothetical protein